MAKLVAKTYGDALFAVACEKKKSVEELSCTPLDSGKEFKIYKNCIK